MKSFLTFFVTSCIILNLAAQPATLQEKLGYSPDAKLLIIHGDDAGVSASTNKAVTECFVEGKISSTAIMVPCPWFPQIAEFAKANPEYDYGIHLTFSSEWETYKWGGVASSSEISSLLNEQGYFYATTPEAVRHAIPKEVEKELRAQIEKALAAGIKPSHFDTHMNTIYGSAELLKIYFKLGAEYRVPVLIMRNMFDLPQEKHIPELDDYPAIFVFSGEPDVDPKNWKDYYISLVENLPAGISEIIVHLAYDDEEMQAMTTGHDYYESTWRQRDLDVVRSKAFAKAIKENDIHIITWGDIQKVMYPEEE